MNDQLQKFARDTILTGLRQCPDGWQMLFKRMYSRGGDLDASIDSVVARMPAEKLDWAMQQVENSLAKLAAADRRAER